MENSLIKAKYFSKKTNRKYVLSDDSGLEVELLTISQAFIQQDGVEKKEILIWQFPKFLRNFEKRQKLEIKEN